MKYPIRSGAVDATTLNDLITRRGLDTPGDRAIVFIDAKQREWTLTYAELLQQAQRVAAGLYVQGFEPGERVMIMLPTGSAFIASFFGVLLAGGIPVPLYPPFFITKLDDFVSRFKPIARDCKPAFLITFKDVRLLAAGIARVVPSLRGVLMPDDLQRDAGPFQGASTETGDTCFLQYTSGSTGVPKGVQLTHANVLENVYGIGLAVDPRPEHVTVSWLPLYHDMGLIGGLLTSLFWRVPLVLISPQQFIKYPIRWLRAIDRFGGTFSPAPNSAYRICLRIPDAQLEGLDLSSWKVAFNGAEPVDLDTLDLFSEKFGPYGFRRTTSYPVYGLAEGTLAVTHPRVGDGPTVEYVDREALCHTSAGHGTAEVCDKDADEAIPSVSVGRPLQGLSLQICADDGAVLSDRTVGEIRVRGPSVMQGYYGKPDATAAVLDDGWLSTGDLGYLADGDLYVTGRKKDLIIKNGRNYYPQDFEEAAKQVDWVRRGGVVAFASTSANTESIVLLVETPLKAEDARKELKRSLRQTVSRNTGVAPDQIELLPPHSVLKTSSGKVRRSDTRAAFESGEIFKQRRTRRKVMPVYMAIDSVVQLVRLRSRKVAARLGAIVTGLLR